MYAFKNATPTIGSSLSFNYISWFVCFHPPHSSCPPSALSIPDLYVLLLLLLMCREGKSRGPLGKKEKKKKKQKKTKTKNRRASEKNG